MRWIHAITAAALSTLALPAYAAPTAGTPAAAPARELDADPRATLRRAARNRALDEILVVFDDDFALTKTNLIHHDASWVPPEQQARAQRMRPGGVVTEYKWHKAASGPGGDYIGIKTEAAGRCELHTAQDGSDAFEECVIPHGEVPPALMARAVGMVEGGKATRSKKIAHDNGKLTYEVDVIGVDGTTGTLYVRGNGDEVLRKVSLPPERLPLAVRQTLDRDLPGGVVIAVNRRTTPKRADELAVQVQRGKAIHFLFFDAQHRLRRHRLRAPATVELSVFRALGEPDPERPY